MGLAVGAPGLIALYLKFNVSGYTVFILSNYDPEDVEPVTKSIMDMFVSESERGEKVEMKVREED